MRPAVLRRIQPLLDAQLGVVTTAQLCATGVDHELPRRERWQRLAHGLWSSIDPPEDEQLLVALRLYAPAAVPSGPLACRWYGLRHAPGVVGVDGLVAHGTTLLGGPSLRLRQTRRPAEGVVVRGQTVAPVERAVADAARWSRLQDARAVVLAALADRRLTAELLLEEADLGSVRSSTSLRRALQDWERGARSAPEAEAADALLDLRGDGPPSGVLLNPEIRLDGVLVGSPDGLCVDTGLGWEMDSVEHHGSGEALDETLQRHLRFGDAGLELLHATPRRFRAAPTAWAREVTARATARQGWRPPPGLVVVPKGPLLGGAALRAA